MKLKGNETIANEVGTHIGTLTWIDWEHNRGRVTLDPKPDADPAAEPVEVECAFRYAGQHWIWNMDAYPEEDIASHSAFAFCMGDRVMLLHPVPATAEDPERPKYVAVAILKEEDDGQGGKTVTLEKRKVWPLYRLGHNALALNFKYSGLGGKGAGFPFVSDDGRRTLQNPFTDQRGHARAFGTPESEGGTGNPRLVVTKESELVSTGNPPVWYSQTYFTPHAIHEFCEAHENIPYVPDVLMQTTPNWRGRIIGWSAEDEILIDNIPVAKVTGAADIEAITPSWRAVTKKFVHVDEANNILTALFVTMDCCFDWRRKENSGSRRTSATEEWYWYPPLYAFYVQRGAVRLDELCIYAAMETPREELPVIAIREDADASWLWEDVQAREPRYILHNQLDNLSDGVEIAFPGHEAEIFFWGGVQTQVRELGNETNTIGSKRRKIGLVISSAADGSIKVEKRLGELEPFGCCNEDNLESYVEYATRTYTDGNGRQATERYISRDYARIKKTLVEEAARVGDAALRVEVGGIDSYTVNTSTGRAAYNTNLTKTYRHVSGASNFVIAEEKQRLSGNNNTWSGTPVYENVRVTLSMIVFTHCDVRNGIYGYWEVTWLDDVSAQDVAYGNTETDPGKSVRWDHYMRSATTKVLTHRYLYSIPYGSGNDDDIIVQRGALSSLIQLNFMNTAGTPGFVNRTHYVHNIYNLPRITIDGRKPLNGEDLYSYKQYNFMMIYSGTEMENDIYTWLQGTTWLHGTKKKSVTIFKTSVYNFRLAPLPSKDIGVWPYYKNICSGYPNNSLASENAVDNNASLAGILFSESMEFDGAALGFGEFSYTVKIKGRDDTAYQCDSASLARLRTCTGRSDATISAD